MSSKLASLFAGMAVTLASATPVFAAGPTGAEIHKGVVETQGIYADQKLAEYVGGLVNEIVGVSEMSRSKFVFTLVDAPDVNAFATRDNYVYVNRGLLAYVQNEAQLVSVMAHEVGHVTKDHVNSAQGQASAARFLAAIAAMLSGSPEVYDAGMQYANSLAKGHGRDNELEADRAAAEYMAKLGYDPNELIEMLSVMKDMETLQKRRAKEQGATKQTYHGIFASHPRNDSRLRNAVTKAGKVGGDGTRDSGAEIYRQMTEGMVWGENFVEKEAKPTRYSDLDLRIRFDFPEGWVQQAQAQGRAVRGSPEGGGAILTMEPLARTAQEPEEYLYNYLNVPQLRDGKAIEPAGLKGFTGILEGKEGKPASRIAVIYYKMGAYIFTGEVDEQAKFAEADKLFLASIETFRPVSGREIAGQSPKRIHWVKATSATTFDALAEDLKLTTREKEDLRLINGYYPSGEPKPGEWIKILKQ